MTPMTNPSTETNPTAETRRSVGRRRYRHAICRERFIRRIFPQSSRASPAQTRVSVPHHPAVLAQVLLTGEPVWHRHSCLCFGKMQRLVLLTHSESCTDLALPHLVKLKAIIFDVDGTLVDSNDIHARCWIDAFEHFGKHFEWDVVRNQIGKGGDLLVPDLLDAREMRTLGDELKKYRTELYKDKYLKDVKPFPRVRDVFETLHGRGVKLALGSSSNQDEVQYYTALLGVGDLVEGSTSKHDADLSKPSPEIFQ